MKMTNMCTHIRMHTQTCTRIYVHMYTQCIYIHSHIYSVCLPVCQSLCLIFFSFLILMFLLCRNNSKRFQLPLLCTFESIYLLGILPLEFFNSLAFPLTALNVKLPFLPLMLTSVYCSLGLFYSWLKFYYHYIAGSSVRKVKHK